MTEQEIIDTIHQYTRDVIQGDKPYAVALAQIYATMLLTLTVDRIGKELIAAIKTINKEE